MRYADVEVGTELPALAVRVALPDLVRYAGAGGDFNPIHWNPRAAREAGLPDVIAHGMLTMAQAGRLVTGWTGDPGAVVELGVRFSAPVVVPDDGVGAEIELRGAVAEKLPGNRVRIEITATSGGAAVLQQATAIVRLP